MNDAQGTTVSQSSRKGDGWEGVTPWFAAIITAFAGVLYFLTAARDIVVGDSPELTMAAATSGVAHPPGYPLFTMLGHLFSLVPLGPIPFRVNLLSAVSNALTVGIVFLTAFRLSQARLASAMGALVLALNPLFWSWSLVAEVFPLNNLLASLLIYLLVIWSEEPEQTGPLLAAFFVGGLAITNHQTIVLLTPAICFIFWRRRAVLFRPRNLTICLTIFFFGLLPYAYVPWAAARHPAYNWGGVSSLGDLFALITRQNYGTLHLTAASHQGGSAVDRVLALCVSFGLLMGSLGFLGLVHAYRRRRWYFWFTLLAFTCAGPFFAIITNLNLASTPQTIFVLERFFLLPMVIAAPLSALGIVAIGELMNAYAPKLRLGRWPVVIGAVAIVLFVSALTNYRRTDQSHNHLARTYAQDAFATVEPGTILLVTGDGLSLPLLY
ncbi:MAG: glycosyltransferase family 117 protein, partial [Chthoniobacterales bacterium]